MEREASGLTRCKRRTGGAFVVKSSTCKRRCVCVSKEERHDAKRACNNTRRMYVAYYGCNCGACAVQIRRVNETRA